MTAQERVHSWVLIALGEETAANAQERALRTVEEVVELAQVCGVDAATLHRCIDYVLARPVGAAEREIAGSLVTLYSTAATLGVDADAAFEKELARLQQPEVIERCRLRQIEKRAAQIVGK